MPARNALYLDTLRSLQNALLEAERVTRIAKRRSYSEFDRLMLLSLEVELASLRKKVARNFKE